MYEKKKKGRGGCGKKWIGLVVMMLVMVAIRAFAEEEPGPTGPSLFDKYLGIVAVLLPAIISMLNRVAWPSWAKWTCSFIVVLIASGIQVLVRDDFQVSDYPSVLIDTFWIAATSYLIFWKPTGVSDMIENGVNPGPKP